MSGQALERAFRAAGGRVIAALAARFRDLDLAEEAFAEACARALPAWARAGVPRDPTAWLFRAAERAALDALRRRRRLVPVPEDLADNAPDAAAALAADDAAVPDERLRLILICCHPALRPDVAAALTLRLVCGLSTLEIARAFLVTETTLAQRLVRARHKIAAAGIPFGLPPPEALPARLEAVLVTVELAYARGHEDAAGTGRHAAFAAEMMALARLLVALVPGSAEVAAAAALILLAEARRPARVDAAGRMVTLTAQDPALFDRALIAEADLLLTRAAVAPGARYHQARLQRAWCGRRSAADPAPWAEVLAIYNDLLAVRDTPVVRLNRAVALSYAADVGRALAELAPLAAGMAAYLPYHAARADMLARAGCVEAARAAYGEALALGPPPAEAAWLQARHDALAEAGGWRALQDSNL